MRIGYLIQAAILYAPRISAESVFLECLRLTPTIVRAALQQQSVFIQITEFPHADEIVVHSRNLSLSGLPSGACETSTLSDVASLDWMCHFSHWTGPTWGSSKWGTIQPACREEIWFQILQACSHIYIMNNQQRWDHRAMNPFNIMWKTLRQQRSSVIDWLRW